MARYVTTVKTARTPQNVFAYMADLRNFTEWDPGVKAVKQVKGSGGGPGAVFDVTVAGPAIANRRSAAARSPILPNTSRRPGLRRVLGAQRHG